MWLRLLLIFSLCDQTELDLPVLDYFYVPRTFFHCYHSDDVICSSWSQIDDIWRIPIELYLYFTILVFFEDFAIVDVLGFCVFAFLRFCAFCVFEFYLYFSILKIWRFFTFLQLSDLLGLSKRFSLNEKKSKKKFKKKKSKKMSRRFITTFFKLAAKDNLIHEKKFLLGQETKKMVFFVMLKAGNATNYSIWQTMVMFHHQRVVFILYLCT